MKKTILNALMTVGLASVAITGAAPALADGWGHEGYEHHDHWEHRGDYGRDGGYREGYREGGYHPYYRSGYGGEGYGDHRYYGRPIRYGYRCERGGTTGAIVGAIAGGLLGREIGRGGYDNRPSGTGLIIGAGAGALAGRAIERSGHRGC